jgi:hypothetical protein
MNWVPGHRLYKTKKGCSAVPEVHFDSSFVPRHLISDSAVSHTSSCEASRPSNWLGFAAKTFCLRCEILSLGWHTTTLASFESSVPLGQSMYQISMKIQGLTQSASRQISRGTLATDFQLQQSVVPFNIFA